MNFVVNNKAQLIKLLHENKQTISDYGVSSIGLFGSFLHNKVAPASDIDFVVEFKAGEKTYDNFIALAYFLEDISGRNVELLTMQSISPYLKPFILNDIEYVSFSS